MPLQHPCMASHGGQAEIDTNNSVGVTNMKSTEISSSTNENERSPPQITQDVNKQRRTGKKDRHTKIYTAQGLRARRMRLSLQIARQFFDLQDMLGFDKASKTIEWLFSKSKKAIQDLMPKNHPPQVVEKNNGKKLSESKSFVGIGETNNRKSRKGANNSNARDTRDKARARARERTIEKMRMRLQLNTCTSLTQLGSSSGLNFTPFETGDELSSRTEEKNSPLESCSPSNIPYLASGVGVIEKFLGRFESSSRSCSNVDYQEDAAVSGILGNMEINRSIINPTGSGTTSMYQLTVPDGGETTIKAICDVFGTEPVMLLEKRDTDLYSKSENPLALEIKSKHEMRLDLPAETVVRVSDDGLNPPTSRFDAVAAFIFLLLASSSILLVLVDDPGKMEAVLINARFSALFLSCLGANLTSAAAVASSSDAGSSRMPSPIFLAAASSSATLFF
ncbi:hypothetical protein RJ640_017891 [Escallonia rubra]|uniref:Uncharacterized protein n=1 Tax=Escallonia rubra TaxID=112253 RepID=A0AA88UDS8_9ASTE|nr:hypothetical protein RJ640_017891 [Escallonia rubra]